MVKMRELIEAYVKRVLELTDLVRGNEQATKQSLIGPFFTMLGYDLTDPRECLPEYKADFGKDRSTKPIDWAFKNNGTFAFFVEAKEIGRKLGGFDEQLADYFAKEPSVKLGILTNGAQWRFFTDLTNPNVMDREPFAKWDLSSEEPAPLDVFNLLHKTQFNPELIRAYAQRQRAQNLLVGELTKLLEPSSDFTKLAVANIETRNLTQPVVDSWKPIVAHALNEWARQRMLTAALTNPIASPSAIKTEVSAIETTSEELKAFEQTQQILGADCAIAYEDTSAYFKVHIAGKRTWVFARYQFGKRQTNIWTPLPQEQAAALTAGRPVTIQSGWSVVALEPGVPLTEVAELLRAAFAHVKQSRDSDTSGNETASK